MEKPVILVTNDDGITAPGIEALVAAAAKIGEVIVVAPDSPQSGKGHAITIADPLRIHKNDIFGDIEAYEVSGTPVDCVKLAMNIVFKDRKKPDLCISGINHGSNASINILYSGTMSAAMEASLVKIPSIGFSLLDYSYDADFGPSAVYAEKLIRYCIETGMGEGKLMSVNIPQLPLEEIKGFKVCHQAEGRWIEEFTESTDPRGQKYYWLTGRFINEDQSPEADINALADGYISVVPSMHDLTDYPAKARLTSIEKLTA